MFLSLSNFSPQAFNYRLFYSAEPSELKSSAAVTKPAVVVNKHLSEKVIHQLGVLMAFVRCLFEFSRKAAQVWLAARFLCLLADF